MACNTVQYTVQNNLCCGCGVCKGTCPKGCITWVRKNGLYLPCIDESQCTNCGLCASVCPGLGHAYEPKETAAETVSGSELTCCNAWSKDAALRHVSASGGVVSTMVRALLMSGQYDGAFCLDSYDYRQQLRTRLYTADEVAACWDQSCAPKSRYLPVSHENAVAYIKENRTARLIFVGTSCAVRGLQAAVSKLRLNREQYLFIGLFCDKVFNYNVLSYFQNAYASGSELDALHFKNKESGGWPGDMKLFPANKDAFYVPLSERAKAKDYFMPERCLYCVDKLNACADISLGDNYTGKDDSPLGSNSVIIRTANGMSAWQAAKDGLEIRNITIADIQKAQYLQGRLNNLYFSDIKASKIEGMPVLNQGVPREHNCEEFTQAWKDCVNRLKSGAIYNVCPEVLRKQMQKDSKKPNPIIGFARRCYRFIKRKMK